MATSVLWLRRDLRVRDHPALVAAHEAAAGAVLPLFVIDPALWDNAALARRERLAASLHTLSAAYAGSLVVRRGAPERVVPASLGRRLPTPSTSPPSRRRMGVAATARSGARWPRRAARSSRLARHTRSDRGT